MATLEAIGRATRVEVFTTRRFGDGRARRLLETLRVHLALEVEECAIVDAYLVEGAVADAACFGALADAVAQEMRVGSPAAEEALPGWDTLIEVTSRPGVADPVGSSAAFALRTASGGAAGALRVQSAR